MHDPDYDHQIQAALAKKAFRFTGIHGDLWRFQPERLNLQIPIQVETLITVEQYNGPGEVAAYEPVCIACGEEVMFMIDSDYCGRSAENGDFCPEAYGLWSRSSNGRWRRDATVSKV